MATATTDQLPQIKNLVRLDDQSGFTTQVGKQVLSSQSVNFINNMLAQLQRAKIPVKSLILPKQAQELDLRTNDRPYYVKFYLSGDVLYETGQFLASRHYFDQNHKQPQRYLDVRLGGKIFYK